MTDINPSNWQPSNHPTKLDGHSSYQKQGPDGNMVWASIANDTGVIREIAAIDAKLSVNYQWINPAYGTEQEYESTQLRQDMKWTQLDVQEDIEEKAGAIAEGKPYDPRVIVQVQLTDEECLIMMRKAHELDITFNQFVEMALREVIDKHKKELEDQR